jgi:hypothetical protein
MLHSVARALASPQISNAFCAYENDNIFECFKKNVKSYF